MVLLKIKVMGLYLIAFSGIVKIKNEGSVKICMKRLIG
jgi:hypothetical protein